MDCAQEAHKAALEARGEVLEIDWYTAMEAGWQGYVQGVRLWRLNGDVD